MTAVYENSVMYSE